MTSVDESNLHFDVRQSVKARNITRLIIAPLLSAGLISAGVWLIPEAAVIAPSVDAVETWNAWAIFGFTIIGIGIYGLLIEVIFALRTFSTSGEWHFRISGSELLWHVPRHAFGKEVGFAVPLEDVKHIELRTVEKDEECDVREYWIHFHSQEAIQLKRYSGISLSSLAKKIKDAGVPCIETRERY